MSKKWPGGIVTPTPATPTGPYQDGAAPGIWTIQQADYWIKQSLWPIAGNVLQRGVFGGGSGGGASTMSYVTIASTGTTTSFGDLTYGRNSLAAVSSATRGVFGSGQTTDSNAMDYITIATTGNATSFGAVPQANSFPQSAGASNGTRGLFAGGQNGTTTSVTYYITIATTGNASTFGVLTNTRNACGATASTTRMVVAGGFAQVIPTSLASTMDYYTIATTGNATSFGTYVATTYHVSVGNISSGTRGVFAGGNNQSTSNTINTISYITIATTGNSVTFGDMGANASNTATTGSTTIGLIYRNTSVDAITIASTGNATSFGTGFATSRSYGAGLSNCHGGL